MKNWLYLLFVLCACRQETNYEFDDIAIYAMWVANEKPTIDAVDFSTEENRAATNQLLILTFGDGEKAPFALLGDKYELLSDRTPVPGERLVLEWFRDSDTARVVVEMPPIITNVVVENDTLSITGSEECSIQWEVAPNNLEFAVHLECLEANPQLLPWAPGNFEELNGGPLVTGQLVLQPESFSCLGTHQLTIAVLNNELLNAFFFGSSDIRGLLKNGPDNVLGGKGFVTGISSKEILLEIE
jgi:hypothetical protein